MADQQETNRNLEGLILRLIASKSETSVAEEIGMSKSAVSKILSNQNGIKLERLGTFFDSIGLMVTDSSEMGELVTVPRRKYVALRDLALAHLQQDALDD